MTVNLLRLSSMTGERQTTAQQAERIREYARIRTLVRSLAKRAPVGYTLPFVGVPRVFGTNLKVTH